MNEEALQRTVESGDAWYYSRSRKALWHKGETSGHFQRVRSIAVDCDADTILLTVDQIGAACHTGHKSCFFRSMTEWEKSYTGSLSILSDLSQEISDKRIHPTEKSYTSYLLQTGIDKICKKIGEESAEVIIAARMPIPLPMTSQNRPKTCGSKSARSRRTYCITWPSCGKIRGLR